jgi:hypothetical protein
MLTTRGTVVNDKQILCHASKFDCTPCPLKARCCPKEPARKIPRSIFERARDVARSLVSTVSYERSRQQRKKIEMLFAHLKRILGLRRLRLRGLTGANDEFLLVATAQNLRKTRQAGYPSNIAFHDTCRTTTCIRSSVLFVVGHDGPRRCAGTRRRQEQTATTRRLTLNTWDET